MTLAKRAVLSNKIYLNVSRDQMMELAKTLTYKIQVARTKTGLFDAVETIRNYSVVSDTVIAIPQGRVDLIPKDYEIIDKRSLVPVEMPYPTISLREGQQLVFDAWEGSGILNAMVGWGKSFTALWFAYKLGQKTLIVTHNTMLRDQWANDVRTMFELEPGLIGSGSMSIDSPIVIANVQTMTKLSEGLSSAFGTIILDECHHVPATTFSTILAASKARYRIGLSGTMTRKDGRHVLFKDFFGTYIAKPPQSNTHNPVVKIIKSPVQLTPGVMYAHKITNLMEDDEYMLFIANIAKAQAARGFKTLIVSDRVGFAHRIAEYLGDGAICITGTSSDFEIREKARIDIASPEYHWISGSRQIFAEGISYNILSCIILTCPIASEVLLEQLIGRIQREYPGKNTPEVIDINFNGSSERKQNNMRIGFYLTKGWEIKYI
jgi:superfamily II DNA or RNA helicase